MAELDKKAVLAEAAAYYYDACELYEDEDLDPEDHLEVIRRAFVSSDCDDFCLILSEMTGWRAMRATWTNPNKGFVHHALVASPEGRLLDVTGWTDEQALARRYGTRKWTLRLGETAPEPSFPPDPDEDGICQNAARIASVIRCLPFAPFNDPGFAAIASHPVAGVDLPAGGPPNP